MPTKQTSFSSENVTITSISVTPTMPLKTKTEYEQVREERKGMTIGEAERWLATNLGYDPEEFD
jgi:hypothetical protein